MELKKNLFEGSGLSREEIIENLEGEAVSVKDDQSYIAPYEVEKIDELEKELVDLNKKIVRDDEKLKSITTPLKSALKEKKDRQKEISKLLNDGGEEVKARTFAIPDYENGMMGIYTEGGLLLNSRPFTPREQQLQINSVRHLKRANM